VVAAREPYQLSVWDERLGADAPEVNLSTRKQIRQTPKADAQHARGAFTVIEEQLIFHRPLLPAKYTVPPRSK
jgi:hypothetical protein